MSGGMKMTACECEHAKHFGHWPRAVEERATPGMHAYGQEFDAQHVEGMNTDYGPFQLCRECRRECHPTATTD